MKKMILVLMVLLIVCLIVLAGCSEYCPKNQFDSSLKDVENVFQEYQDTERLAFVTDRAALSPLISKLQDIKMKLENTTIPECLKFPVANLDNYMKSTNDGYILFMGNNPNESISIESHFPEIYRAKFDLQIEYLKKCTINNSCRPDDSVMITPTPAQP